VLRLFFIPLLLSFVNLLFAQETDTHLYLSESKNERYDAGSPVFSAMIIPAYSPEMGFNFSGSMMLSFKTLKNNDYLSHSCLPVNISLSPNGGLFYYDRLVTYWFDDRLIFTCITAYINRDDNYWGKGMNNAVAVEKGKLTTAYHQDYLTFKPTAILRITDVFHAGLVFSFSKMSATELTDLLLEDPEILKYGTSVTSSGMGGLLSFDTRDIQSLPSKGIYTELEGIHYIKALGSDHVFTTWNIDYRMYFPVIRKGSVLALQAFARIGSGHVPWSEMSQLGSSGDLRGYYYGQYRDISSAYALLEYRHTLMKPGSDELSRHGFVFWIGMGTVYETLTKINNALLSTGLGYRYTFQPGCNLRLDFGFGTEYVGLYLNFFEAF
jgi:hypothetical protein